MDAKLGYIKDKNGAKLFPKTLGKGVQYSIVEGFDYGLTNPIGNTLNDTIKKVLGREKENTETVKEMLDILLYSVYGTYQGVVPTPQPNVSVSISNSTIYIEGDSSSNKNVSLSHLSSQYNANKATLTFSNATDIKCWYDQAKTNEIQGSGNTFVILDIERFILPQTISYSNSTITKSITIYYTCKSNGIDVSRTANVSVSIKFVAPVLMQATSNLTKSQTIGIKYNVSDLPISVNLSKSQQADAISNITSIKYGFSKNNLTTINISSSKIDLTVGNFIKDTLPSGSRLVKDNGKYYVILNDALTQYNLSNDLQTLYIVYEKTPKSTNVDANCLIGQVDGNKTVNTIELKPTVQINGTKYDFYFTITEYTNSYPYTPIFYSGQNPNDGILLSNLFKSYSGESYDGSWRMKQVTPPNYILDYNLSKVTINYDLLGGSTPSPSPTSYIYYGVGGNELIQDMIDDYDSYISYQPDLETILNGQKLAPTETLNIEGNKYYRFWMALPNGVTVNKCLLGGEEDNIYGWVEAPITIGDYTVYYISADVYIFPELFTITFNSNGQTQQPSQTPSDIVQHPQNRMVSFMFRSNVFSETPKLWSKTISDSDFRQLGNNNYKILQTTITYDDNTTSTFYWGYLTSYQNGDFQIKFQ